MSLLGAAVDRSCVLIDIDVMLIQNQRADVAAILVMGRALQIPPKDPYVLAVEADQYFCPACGIGLGQSEFETPASDYYCPFCATCQTPASS